jgi:hypothetical protein
MLGSDPLSVLAIYPAGLGGSCGVLAQSAVRYGGEQVFLKEGRSMKISSRFWEDEIVVLHDEKKKKRKKNLWNEGRGKRMKKRENKYRKYKTVVAS